MNFTADFLVIDGIDEDMAKKLAEHGIDSIEKLAAASEQDLAAIDGLAADLIPGIIERAGQLAAAGRGFRDPLAELLDDATHLKDEVEKLVLHIRERFTGNGTPSKAKKALRKEVSLTLASLERVEAALSSQLRQLSKGLAKADARISKVADSEPEEITEELRRARRKIDKSFE
jgi:transcription termination factor NusA